MLNTDNVAGALAQLNIKLWQINKLLENTDLSIIDISKKADNTFERIIKLLEIMTKISSNLKELRSDIGITSPQETKKPLVETFAR